jgi:hypothetical protein
MGSSIMKEMGVTKWSAALCFAALAGLSGQSALAQSSTPQLTTTFTNAAAPEGSQAFPSFQFTFDTAFDLSAFELTVKFDKDKLTFNAAASTLSFGVGTPQPISVVLAGLNAANSRFLTSPSAGDFSSADTSGMFAFGGAYVSPFDSTMIPAGSTVVMTTVFSLNSGFKAGESTSVQVVGFALDPAFQEVNFDPIATVSAVPEPETWMLLLGGLGLIASRVRRASKARTDSEAASA